MYWFGRNLIAVPSDTALARTQQRILLPRTQHLGPASSRGTPERAPTPRPQQRLDTTELAPGCDRDRSEVTTGSACTYPIARSGRSPTIRPGRTARRVHHRE